MNVPPTSIVTRLGLFASALGCAVCLPVLASLGAALGAGVLSPYEGVLLHQVLPALAAIALLANGLGWWGHRQWARSVVGVAGPAVVLAAASGSLDSAWAATALYAGLGLMAVSAMWNLFRPACAPCQRGGGGSPRP